MHFQGMSFGGSVLASALSHFDTGCSAAMHTCSVSTLSAPGFNPKNAFDTTNRISGSYGLLYLPDGR